ncbi:MAG: class III extradiol ring-cleavage dioxygenase, partial [Pseudomonadota bacterium]
AGRKRNLQAGNIGLDAMEHIRIGRALSELKHENILVLGSGYSFHNMRALMEKSDDSIDLKNQEFENWLQGICCDNKISEDARASKLADWALAPHARYCHPREEHLLPLHVCYGLAQKPATAVFNGKVGGFLTKAYQW